MENKCKKLELASAIFDYNAIQSDHIFLEQGDIIEIHQKNLITGLWYGEKVKSKQSGWFPSSHVQQIEGKVGKKAVAVLTRPFSLLFQNVLSRSSIRKSVQSTITSINEQPQQATTTSESNQPEFKNVLDELMKKQCDQANGTFAQTKVLFKSQISLNKAKKPAIAPKPSLMDNPESSEKMKTHENTRKIPRIANLNTSLEQLIEHAKAVHSEDEPIYSNANSELDYVIVIESHEAERDGDISIEINDHIRVLSRQFPNWWRGRNVRTGAIGLFPSKAVQPIKSATRETDDINEQDGCSSRDEIYENGLVYGNNDIVYDMSRKVDKTHKSYEVKYMEMTKVQLSSMMFNYKQNHRTSIDAPPSYHQYNNNDQQPQQPIDNRQSHSDYSSSKEFTQNNNKSLKRWTKDPAEKVLLNLVERFKVIHELMDSEHKYTNEVDFVLKKFKTPINHSILVNANESEQFFSTLTQLHLLHLTFHQDITRLFQCEQGLYNPCVGALLQGHFEKMLPIYKNACQANLLVAKLETDPQLSAELEQIVQSTEGKQFNLHFKMFLLRPMQRITKYPLLIEKMIKTTPSIHPDNDECKRALEVAKSLCSEINKQMDPERGQKELKIRANIVEALIQFQEDYTKHFTFALTTYILPIQSVDGLMEDGSLFFINYQQIYSINYCLLNNIICRFEDEDQSLAEHCIGSMLLEHYQKMQSVYQSFGLGYTEVVSKIENDPQLSGRFDRMSSVRNKSSLSFKGGLLRTMQQFTKLPLIIDELLRIAPASHQCDHINACAQDLNMAESFCKEIDNALDSICQRWEWGSLNKLYWIYRHILRKYEMEFKIDITETAFLGSRVLLHSGILFTPTQTLVAFLFNDFLLLACADKKIQNIPNGNNLFDSAEINSLNYSIEGDGKPLLLDDFQVEQQQSNKMDNFATSNQFCIEILSQKRCLQLRANSLDEWACWLEAIAIAKHNYENYLNCMPKLNDNYQAMEQQRKSLLAIITLTQIEVINLYNPNYTLNVYCKVALGKNWSTCRPIWTTSPVAMDKHFNPARKVVWPYNYLIELYNKADLLLFRCFEANPYGPHQCLGEAELAIPDGKQFKNNLLRDITKGLPLKPPSQESPSTSKNQLTDYSNRGALLRVTFNVQ